MRQGLKWGWLAGIAVLTAGTFLSERLFALSVQEYDIVATAECTPASWEKKGDGKIQVAFQCGERSVTIDDSKLLAAYLNKGGGTATCQFKRGRIFGDENVECGH